MATQRKTMRPDQQRYLRDRLQTIRNSKPRHYDAVKIAEPVEVKRANAAIIAARRIVSRFEKKCVKAKQRRNATVSRMEDACRREILFGSADEAIKALDRFEAAKF